MSKNLTAEKTFSEMAKNAAVTPETVASPDKSVIMLKRIGGTTYQVAVHFSATSKETLNDKVARMIKNETESEVVQL